MDTLLAIASRRDERRTLPDPLPRELVLRLLDAGRLSGSSRNGQPWTFAVPTSRARIEAARRLPSTSPRTSSAPASSSRCSCTGKGPVLFDAGRAAQSMLLAAWAEGLASCPNGIADVGARATALDATDDETPVIVLTFGLPERSRATPDADTAAEWSARANRKPLDEVVRWLARDDAR